MLDVTVICSICCSESSMKAVRLDTIFNTLAPRKFEWNFRHVIFKQILVIDACGISCEIALLWMSLDFTSDQSTLVQVMAWCRQVTSHYLSQCWPSSLSPYGVTRPQSANELIVLLTQPKLGQKNVICLVIIFKDWLELTGFVRKALHYVRSHFLQLGQMSNPDKILAESLWKEILNAVIGSAFNITRQHRSYRIEV